MSCVRYLTIIAIIVLKKKNNYSNYTILNDLFSASKQMIYLELGI